MKQLPLNELTRKLLHLSSLFYPILYLVTQNRDLITDLTGIIFIFLVSFEFLKVKSKSFRKSIGSLLGFILRDGEDDKITGATFFMAGVFWSYLLFDPMHATIGVFILVLADTVASIIGIRFGKFKITDKKTLEGTLAFFAVSMVILLLFSVQKPFMTLVAISVLVAVIELFSRRFKLDDNLLIPVFTSLLLSFS